MPNSSDSNLPDGTNESPNSPSSTGNVQQGSETVSMTKAEFDAFQKRLARLEDDTRSNKDRAVKRTNERMDGFEEKIKPLLESAQRYIAKGSTVNEAIAQAQDEQSRVDADTALREMALAWKSGKLPSTLQGSKESEGVDVTEVITDLGLDPSDPLVKVAFEGKNFTEAEAEAAAAKLLREKKRQPTPTQAQAPSTPSAPVRAGTSEQQANILYAELGNLLKSPTQNAARISAIKKELTDGGFPL